MSNKPLTLDHCLEVIETKAIRVASCHSHTCPGAAGLEYEFLCYDWSAWQQDAVLGVPLDVLYGALRRIGARRSWQISEDLSRIEVGEADLLTFEPGGQLELSTRPFDCLRTASVRVRQFREALRGDLHDEGIHLVAGAMEVKRTIDQIGLQLRKKRYIEMDDYFSGIGPKGQRMMRQTCTNQVDLDYAETEEMSLKRVVAANLLAPIATATFANSPYLDGRMSPDIESERAEAWRHCDRTRTGLLEFPPGILPTRRQLAEQYMNRLLNQPMILPTEAGRCTLRDWLAAGRATLDDFTTHQSLFFPETRLRGFIEFRSFDAQGFSWQDVLAGWLCALIYTSEGVDFVLDQFWYDIDQQNTRLRLASFGLRSPSLARDAKRCMEMALHSYGRLTPCYQDPKIAEVMQQFAEHFTFRQRTPASDIRDCGINPAGFDRCERSWEER